MSTRWRRRVPRAWRASFFTLLVTVLLTSVGLTTSSNPGLAADPRPNIVVIMTDDQPSLAMWPMQDMLTLLKEQGTRFNNAHANYPLCCPSRATFVTGQVAHNHEVLNNGGPDGGYPKLRPRQNDSMPVWLSAAGYQTVHIGKYLNGYGSVDESEVPPGWGEWYGLLGSSAYRMWGYRVNEKGPSGTSTVKQYGTVYDEDPALYQTDVLKQKALDYIDRKAPGDSPFFLSFQPLAPHTESYDGAGGASRNPRPAPRHRGTYENRALPQPPSFNEPHMGDKPAHMRPELLDDPTINKITKRYRSMLESLLAVDDAVRAIVNRLSAHGELSNTLIIFTSDNGRFFGEHRWQGKIHAYKEAALIPLIMRGPGVPVGRITPAMVSNVDIPRTILEAAQATSYVPDGYLLDGLDLRAIAQNPASVDGRTLLLESGKHGTGKVAEGRYWYSAVRTDRYLYVEHWQRVDGVDVARGKELYDDELDADQNSSQHDNAAYDQVRLDLAARLHALETCAGANCHGL